MDAILFKVSDDDAVIEAIQRIDQTLSNDPTEGEGRPGGQRVSFASPLGVRFEVVADDERILVIAVWLIRAV